MRGEYRVREHHPDFPGKVLIVWRPNDASPVWIHVAIVDDLEDVSEAMVEHRDKGWA
jgi:hypothetical protein